jgi:hypothetical protein
MKKLQLEIVIHHAKPFKLNILTEDGRKATSKDIFDMGNMVGIEDTITFCLCEKKASVVALEIEDPVFSFTTLGITHTVYCPFFMQVSSNTTAQDIKTNIVDYLKLVKEKMLAKIEQAPRLDARLNIEV